MVFSRRIVLALFLILLPVLYQLYCPQSRADGEEDAIVEAMSAQWDAMAGDPPHSWPKIAVGVNANLDLIVSATDLLRGLNVTPGQPSDRPSLTSLGDLQDVVAHSMLHCAGIERFFADQETFQQTVEAAARLPHRYHIGGNAALMAEKLQQTVPKAQVMLVAPVGPKLRDLLSPHLLTPTLTTSSHDEVHVILEYPVGESWGDVRSQCANRVIYSHDFANSRMAALHDLRDQLQSFKPDLIVFSGAHILEGQPADFRNERLREIQAVVGPYSPRVPVHLELATVGDLGYLRQLVTHLLPNITSFGLNEQELVAMAKALDADFDFEAIPAKPSVEQVSDLLHWLTGRFGSVPGSWLSRVHFHSLSFHVVATRLDGPWGDGQRSVIAGTRVAGLQACDVEKFQPDLFKLKLNEEFSLSVSDHRLSLRRTKISPHSPIVVWERGGWRYHLSPVLVCKHPVQTVGLGDAISALGLIYSSFTHYPQ